MKTYLDCWISAAKSLFSQALAGEPTLQEAEGVDTGRSLSGTAYGGTFQGDVNGAFVVVLDPLILQVPLLGEGIDQRSAWAELLREIAEAAAGELLAASGRKCAISSFGVIDAKGSASRLFELKTADKAWVVAVLDDLDPPPIDGKDGNGFSQVPAADTPNSKISPGIELLLDVELEAALRFGCCEMPLGEILELGPGDVVELDRHVSDPVDLVVGNKIVAKGDVVLINGSFGLRVTEVATPQKRLESIRCLF